MCGGAGQEVHPRRFLCVGCSSKYAVGNCRECGISLLTPRGEAQDLCTRCRLKPQVHTLTSEDLRELDQRIFKGDILSGIQYVRNRLQLSLGESQAVFVVRYEELRASAPQHFTESHEEYWEGFYS
jgi:hypothetical protein